MNFSRNHRGLLTPTSFHEYIIGPDYTDINIKEERKKIALPSKCVRCVSFCNWYSKKYQEFYGFNEFETLIARG